MRMSVLMCCYNAAGTIAQALESLWRQTLPSDAYEVVVVDDGSTDATLDIAQRSGRGRSNVRYIRHERNQGLPAACNRGLSEAQGAYLSRLDADDLADPEWLQAMCRPLDAGATDFVYCDRLERHADGREEPVRLEPFDLFKLIAIGTMMRCDMLRAIGGYRNLFWEEHDLHLRYLLNSGLKPHRVPQPLVTYTIHPGSLTADPDRVRMGWQEFEQAWPDRAWAPFGQMPGVHV